PSSTCGSREKPESVAADHCAGLDYASAPYPAMALDYGIRTYARPGPDIGALVHIGTGFHHDIAFQTAMHRGSRSDAVARAGSMRRRIMETIGKGGEQGGHGRMHGGDPQDRDTRAVQAVVKAVGLQGAGFGFGNDQGGAQGPAYPQRGFRPQKGKRAGTGKLWGINTVEAQGAKSGRKVPVTGDFGSG